jgi:chaperonin cofactor prefoldin
LLNYQGLIAPLVGAVQDLQDKVDTLTKQNQDLEARLAKLESLLLKEGDI